MSRESAIQPSSFESEQYPIRPQRRTPTSKATTAFSNDEDARIPHAVFGELIQVYNSRPRVRGSSSLEIRRFARRKLIKRGGWKA